MKPLILALVFISTVLSSAFAAPLTEQEKAAVVQSIENGNYAILDYLSINQENVADQANFLTASYDKKRSAKKSRKSDGELFGNGDAARRFKNGHIRPDSGLAYPDCR